MVEGVLPATAEPGTTSEGCCTLEMAVLEHLTLMKACMREYLQWPLSWVQQVKATVNLKWQYQQCLSQKPLDTWNSTLSTMMPRCHGQGLKARKSSNSNGASKPQSWSEGRSSTRNDSREWDLGRGLDQKRPLHGKRWRCSRKWYMALLCDILLVHVSCWLLHFWMAEHIRLLTLKVFSSYFFSYKRFLQ